MPTIRYFSVGPGTGASTEEFLNALFNDLVSFQLTPTQYVINSEEVRAVMTGSGLTYAFALDYPIPLPAPKTGVLDSLTMKLKSDGRALWTIENWNVQAKGLNDALVASDEEDFHNVFLGGNDRMFGTNFSDQLRSMRGNDSVYGGGAADSIMGDAGSDKIYGGAGGDAMDGGLGRDSVYGGAGSDALYGGDGNDLLAGGAAGDLMIGGSGADRFLFDTPAVDGQENNIGDFEVAADKILLDNDAFTALAAPGVLTGGAFRLGSDATTGAHRILYDSATGNIWYDRDGSGAAAKVLLAIVDDGLAITREHFQIVE
jgi:Ca2+-binding RTX toxin-like protein